MITDEQRSQWIAAAAQLGRDAGAAAGTWAADGNTTDEHRRNVLAMLADGDPAADDFLPARPDLSGQWADAPTPTSLFEDVTGLDSHAEASWNVDAYHALVDELCSAWEDGVSETFEASCERELRAGLSED